MAASGSYVDDAANVDYQVVLSDGFALANQLTVTDEYRSGEDAYGEPYSLLFNCNRSPVFAR